ncbi:MAG: DUF5673 domain-containing protein [Nitrospirota bacterium]
MEILLLFTITILTVPFSISLLYSFYRYQHRPKGQVLLTIKSISSERKIYGIVLSLIFALIAASLLLVYLGEELKGHKIDLIGWIVIVEVIIFFGVLSLAVFQRRAGNVLQFTDKGIILDFEFFEWDKIDEYKWEMAVRFLGLVVHYKENPDGDILFFQSGWRWRRSHYSFDANTKQQANNILKSKGKMKP